MSQVNYCPYIYVYYDLHKCSTWNIVRTIERGEPEARKLFLPCQPLPVVNVEA